MRPKSTIPINQYFGNTVGNCQDPDEPWDQTRLQDGNKLSGKGSQGGGSRKTPQAKRSGSATLGSSRPRGTQKLRG